MPNSKEAPARSRRTSPLSGSAEIEAMVARTAPAVLELLRDGAPRARSVIIAALADRLAFGLGLLLAALTASSLVAWRFGFDPALGTPLVWHLYSPLAVLAWARSWGLDQAYRPQFLSALTLPLLPMMLPFAVLWLRELYGPMRTPERDADEGWAGLPISSRPSMSAAGRPAWSSAATAKV